MATKYPIATGFHITAGFKNDHSYLADSYYSQPLKMMRPFKWKETGIKVLMMTSAPGMLDGDEYDIKIKTEENAHLWLTAQSYEKIFPSLEEGSKRYTEIEVANNSYLRYVPLPTIPYKDSIFEANTQIHLENKNSRFTMLEVLTAGRVLKKEAEIFEYRKYKSLVDVYTDGEIIYRDNSNFQPQKSDMTGFGMYEGYTHLANLLIINFDIDDNGVDALREIIDSKDEMIGGVTRLASGDLLVRLFGYSGQKISDLGEDLIDTVENNYQVLR